MRNRHPCLDTRIEPRLKCKGCDYEKDCGGGCPATNFAETGNVCIPGEAECKLGLVWRRINVHMRQRHDELFGTDWTNRVEVAGCIQV